MADPAIPDATGEGGNGETTNAPNLAPANPKTDADAKANAAAETSSNGFQPSDISYTRFNPEVHPAGWWEPTSEHLSVRDVKYLKDKKKTKSQPSVFVCVDVEALQVPKAVKKVEHVCAQPWSAFQRMKKKAPENTPYKGAPGSGFTFVVHFQVPLYQVTMYFQRKPDEKIGDEGGGPAFEAALRAFLEGDDAYKTQHLKFFPVVTEGAWVVRQVVGGKPAIIAKKIECSFFEGDNYFEVDVDVSTSKVAKGILGVVKSYAKKVTFDLAWGFEGKTVEHLPERILGISRFEHVHMSMLPSVPVDEFSGGGGGGGTNSEKASDSAE